MSLSLCLLGMITIFAYELQARGSSSSFLISLARTPAPSLLPLLDQLYPQPTSQGRHCRIRDGLENPKAPPIEDSLMFP